VKTIINLAVLLISLLASVVIMAHQQKEAYSNILFNQRTGMLEISHRFYLHDAEHALQLVTGQSADLIADESSQQRFSDYLLSHFALKAEDQLLELAVVGFEVEGKYFWLYQEVAKPDLIDSVTVRMSALQEVWPAQINHINVDAGQGVSSARIGVDDGFKKIDLD